MGPFRGAIASRNQTQTRSLPLEGFPSNDGIAAPRPKRDAILGLTVETIHSSAVTDINQMILRLPERSRLAPGPAWLPISM